MCACANCLGFLVISFMFIVLAVKVAIMVSSLEVFFNSTV